MIYYECSTLEPLRVEPFLQLSLWWVRLFQRVQVIVESTRLPANSVNSTHSSSSQRSDRTKPRSHVESYIGKHSKKYRDMPLDPLEVRPTFLLHDWFSVRAVDLFCSLNEGVQSKKGICISASRPVKGGEYTRERIQVIYSCFSFILNYPTFIVL